jgi:hypothetical protein
MDRGERERWNKLSSGAKHLAAILARCLLAGHAAISVNQLRLLGVAGSRDIVDWMDELCSRAYGRIDNRDGANPVFIMVEPAFQTLIQAGKIQVG